MIYAVDLYAGAGGASEGLLVFPDEFTAIIYNRKPAKDGPRYKAIGNSMAVPVIRWILSRIEAYERIEKIA